MLLAINSAELTARADSFRHALNEITGEFVPVTRRPFENFVASICIESVADDQDRFIRTLTDRGREEWSLFLWPGSALSLYVSFDEEWHIVQASKKDWRYVLLSEQGLVTAKNSAAGIAVFGGLRIRFYLKRKGESSGVRQWLRCEWEPYRYAGGPIQSTLLAEEVVANVSFDAACAAHPHFHFDSIPLTTSAYEKLSESPGHLSNDFGAADFDSFGSTGFITSQDTDLRHVHLPSTTMWASNVYLGNPQSNIMSPLPHQRYPASTAELDNWFAWNIYYFLNQFQVAVGDS